MSPAKSKIATIVGALLALVTALADQSTTAALAVLFGGAWAAKVNTGLTVAGVILSAFGRALMDADGDGTPDILQKGT